MSTLADPPGDAPAAAAFPRPERFFVPGGTLRANAESYAARAADHELLAALLAGEFCYVLTSRQMGKSSLMVRTAGRLQQEGVTVVLLDLTNVGQNLTTEQWYFTLLMRLARQLKLQDEAEASWEANQRESPLARWMTALREVVLERVTGPATIFIDEIDCVQSLPFSADEFFAGIRECYNRRPQDERLRALTFCLLGVATPSDLIRDQRLTPFNIGRGIPLCDFTPAEAAVLAQGLHPHPAIAGKLLKRILHWTGGHPYLTQKLCLESVKAGADATEAVDAVAGRIFFSHEARDLDDNLHFVRERLLRSNCDRAALLDVYAKIYRNRRGQRIADDDLDPLVNELRLAGIVRVHRGYLQVRNEIYRRVFDLHWTRENMPEAEVRRQRDAFYRGVWKVAGYSAVAMTVFAALLAFALQKERAALRQEQVNAELLKVKEKLLKDRDESIQEKQAALDAKDKSIKDLEKAKREIKQKEDEARQKEDDAVRTAVQTQDKLKDVLTALQPLLATKSNAREEVLEAAKKLFDSAAQQPRKSDARIELGQVHLLCATSRLYSVFGDRENAETRAQEALGIVKAWVGDSEPDLALTRELVDCQIAIGDAIVGEERSRGSLRTRNRDELERAFAAYDQAVQLASHAAETDKTPKPWLLTVFSTHLAVGDVRAKLEEKDAALARFAEASRVIEAALKQAPDDADFTLSLATYHDRVGDVRLHYGEIDLAKREFRNALNLREAVKLDPADSTRLDAIALSYNKLGKAYQRSKEALDWYRKSLAIRIRLAESDPGNYAWQRNLSLSYNNVASLEKEFGSKGAAIEFYRKRLEISQRLYEEVDPSNSEWRIEYGEALNRLADNLLNYSDKKTVAWDEALPLSRRAVDLTERRDLPFLTVLIQAQRLNGLWDDRRSTIRDAEKLIKERSLPADVLEEYRKEASKAAPSSGKKR